MKSSGGTYRLIQKKRLGYRKFILCEDRIMVETKINQRVSNYEIKIGRIGFDLYYQKENMLLRYIIAGILAPFLVGALIAWHFHVFELGIFLLHAILWWGVTALICLSTRQDDVAITGGEMTLFFYRNIPDEKTVSVFIGKVIGSSKNYLRTHYAHYREHLSKKHYMTREPRYHQLEGNEPPCRGIQTKRISISKYGKNVI
jgi:hypothetical protein